MDALVDVLVCPHCRSRLAAEGGGLQCERCAREYPCVSGIPCVFEDTGAMLARWREMAAAHLGSANGALELVIAELLQPGTMRTTRSRLRRIASAMRENLTRTSELLVRSGLVSAGTPPGTRGAGGAEELRLGRFHELVFRDWGWGDDGAEENRHAFAALESVLEPGRPLGNVLVLGAGACRLAYDVHQRLEPTTTIALDVNPLPFLVAREAIFGEGVELVELPVNPHDADAPTRRFRLCAPSPARAGFHLLFADGLRPPLRPGSIDTVITPWFIDQVPSDLPALLGALHELLAPRGAWINSGPLIYPQSLPRSRRYGERELLELLPRVGFEVGRTSRSRSPFMFSPGSSSGRTVHLLSFATSRAAPREAPTTQPPWATADDVPVPRFAGLSTYIPPHPAIAAVAAAVDGEASVADIAARFYGSSPLGEEEMRRGARMLLLEIFEACEET